jgi:4,5:9,10-diseco-3-hydroxy-5,9,17-trioxoandrosta-1(10),2-diene-4-oate hydrolase
MRTSLTLVLLAFLVVLPLAVACSPVAGVTRAPALDGTALRLALAVPEPRQHILVDGVVLAVHDTGPVPGGLTVVCLHAIGHGGGDFAGFERAFAGRHRVISVDWPGHGASRADRQPASAVRYAELLGGVLDALQLQRAVLLGNSIGGAAAIAFAARAPGRVQALVLANPGGLDPGGLLPRLFIGHLAGRFAAGARGDERFARWYERYYDDILLTPEARSRRRAIVSAAYPSAPVLAEAWRSFARPEADLRMHLPALRMPVLVTWAMKDWLIRWSRNRAALRILGPSATVVRFERSGHAAFLEEPERFHAEVGRFLARLR